ncbi:MAG: MoaD/ThiS family protein [Thermodesulfobacteriota bacterium]|nr:MoaD/ThiS family protein [Thermodesulfobacteriota bacterium]
MPKVIVPSPLRKHVDNQREVVVDGNSLKETMEHFLQQYPALKAMNHDSALLSIFVNSRLVRTGMETWENLSLNSDDEITLIVPIAGG